MIEGGSETWVVDRPGAPDIRGRYRRGESRRAERQVVPDSRPYGLVEGDDSAAGMNDGCPEENERKACARRSSDENLPCRLGIVPDYNACIRFI